MILVNKILLLYEECRTESRDVRLSLELRDGVEMFTFSNILHPFSCGPPSKSSRSFHNETTFSPLKLPLFPHNSAAIPLLESPRFVDTQENPADQQ